MLLRDCLAVLMTAIGILAAPVAAVPQDKKPDQEPGGLVDRIVDTYVKTETARARRTRKPLDPLADALARVRDREKRGRDEQELPATHPLVITGRARADLAGGILTQGYVKKARVATYAKPGAIRLDARGQLYLTFPSEGTKETAAREVEAYVAKAKEAYDKVRKASPRLELAALKVGQDGYFADEYYRPIAFRVFQVIDADAVLLAHGGKLFWLDQRGHGLVDDATFTSTARWEVAGTRQYRARGGENKTVFVIRPKAP
ncbi:MAG TPA: hypothetical protein VM597_30430 [Gemmataceae bacterium]|jgi:hypothetical protein|nr:hypothetical protein [Gemmataceae bacterium]